MTPIDKEKAAAPKPTKIRHADAVPEAWKHSRPAMNGVAIGTGPHNHLPQ